MNNARKYSTVLLGVALWHSGCLLVYVWISYLSSGSSHLSKMCVGELATQKFPQDVNKCVNVYVWYPSMDWCPVHGQFHSHAQ